MADFDPKAFLAEDTSFDPKAFLGKKEDKPIQQLSDKEIVEKMKFWKPENRAALMKEAERLGPVKSDLLAAPMRFALSVAKLPAGAAKLAGYDKPAEIIKQADLAAKEFSGPEEGFLGSRGPISTAASLGGDIYGAAGILKGIGAAAKPVAAAAPATAPIISAVSKSPVSQSVLGGAALGALGSETNAPLDVLQSTAIGAGAGGIGHGIVAGAGRVLSPKLERLKEIKAKGFNVPEFIKESSVGQFFGGVPQKVEDFMTNIPFSGAIANVERGAKSAAEQGKNLKSQIDVQRNLASKGLGEANTAATVQKAELLKQQQLDLDERLKQHVATLNANVDKKYADFSNNMINRSLEPIGEKLPPGVRGTDAVKYAQDVRDAAYEKAVPLIGDVTIGKEQVNALKQIAKDYKRALGGKDGDYYKNFVGDIDDLLARVGPSRVIEANEWHNVFKDLGEKAFKNKGFGVKGTQAEYGDALTKLKSSWMDIIENTPGAEAIKQANKTHSMLQVPETAAGYLKTYTEKGGEFDPKDFLRALKAEASRKKFSAGEARLQDEALSTFEQIAKDKANVKTQEEAFKKQLVGKKGEQKSAMKAENVTAAQNLANQRAYLEMIANRQQKPGISDLVEDIGYKPSDQYAQKRLGYTAAGLGGGYYLSRLLGITPEQQMLGAGALLGGTNVLNSRPVQSLIKQAAVAERPEIVKQAGQGLQNIAVPSSLVGTKAVVDERALEKERRKGGALPVPMAEGGLVQHYFLGGSVAPVGGIMASLAQQLSQPLSQPTQSSGVVSNVMGAAMDNYNQSLNQPTQSSGVIGGPIGAAGQPTNPTNDVGADRTLNTMNPTSPGPGNPVTTPNVSDGDYMMTTNVGAGNPMVQNNPVTNTNIGVGNPMTQNNVMPKIRQFSPQRTPFVPRRTQNGGMPTYMQNNQAYEAQRQSRNPFVAFPAVNKVLPQGRVTPRRGIPVARMAEGGPVKKK